jgi:uncharacterized protein YaeQ
MATGATMYRLKIELSDVDRGIYESLDIRAARHPSETMRFLLTRAIAFCLCYEEGIAFSRGLSTQEEPAVWVKALDGTTTTWIEVGTPSAERLHKAAKAVRRVVVFTHHAPENLLREVRGKKVHRAEEIEVYALEPTFLDALTELTERNASWDLVHTEGQVYVTVGGRTVSGAITKHALANEGNVQRRIGR